jgi:hypothetical protein
VNEYATVRPRVLGLRAIQGYARLCILVACAACSDEAESLGVPGGSSGSGDSGPDRSAGDVDAGHPARGDASGSAAREASANADGATGDGASAPALVNPGPASKFFVGTNFWNVDWEGADDYFVSNVDFATTTNPWQPQLLLDLAPYAVLRFMDWNQTNSSNNPQAAWSTRTQKTAAQSEPVAFEWQIDLCNRTKKDYWVNVPHESNATYWQELAQLVHDQLDPGLRVYVEWSNEVWNGSFPQQAYAAAQAQSLGLSGSIPDASYYVYASVRVYEAFEAVFGQGSPRLVKVLAGQAAWTGPCQAHMTALADPTINPKATRPSVYAIAPYFSGTSIADLGTSISTTVQWAQAHTMCVASLGLPLISYEGGSDSFSASGNGCQTLQHDPGMHDLYSMYLDGMSGAKLGGPLMQYTHSGTCWGLVEKTGDSPSISPKYKGLLDWLAAHP